MGVRIGGGVGPVSWSMPIRAPRGTAKGIGQFIYLSLLMFWWMLYAIFLFYKYLAIGAYWLVRQGIQLWQQRQARREGIRDRADAQHAAYLAGDPSGIYGQHPPTPIPDRER